MEINKKYKSPPIKEAIFELFFESINWTPATPGIFFNLVKDKFPIIIQLPGGFGISFMQGIQVGPGNNGIIQFKSEDGKSIIQLSNNLLTVNRLPEYIGWEFYKIMILYSIECLNKSLKITKINRVGLKSINKIDIKSHSYENFKRCFNVYPTLVDSANTNLNSIILNYESFLNENKDVLAVHIATLNKEIGYEAPALFQLYYTRITDVKENLIEEWLETAHKQLYESFDTILTTECKSSFDNDK